MVFQYRSKPQITNQILTKNQTLFLILNHLKQYFELLFYYFKYNIEHINMSLHKSPTNHKNKNNSKRPDQHLSQTQSQASIEFSDSFPSLTRRSQSPPIKNKLLCEDCGCSSLKITIHRLKAENKMLSSENQVLRQEIAKYKRQNLDFEELQSITSKRLQAKNMECDHLKSRMKELLERVDELSRQNQSISMCSMKFYQDKQDTLTTICIQKEREIAEQEAQVAFNRRIQSQVSKYVEVKMKLDLTLRKLQQKQLMINFLQRDERYQ